MPGQCFSMPSLAPRKMSGSELEPPSESRACMCTSAAPAAKASCVLSIISGTEIGTAGVSDLRGTEPLIATVMMQAVVMRV